MSENEEKELKILSNFELQMAIVRVALDVSSLAQVLRGNALNPTDPLKSDLSHADSNLKGIHDRMMTLCGKLLGEEDERLS